MANPITLEEASKKAVEYMEKRERERYENPVSLPDLESALDALILEDIPPMLEPHDITVMSLAARGKCSPAVAKRVLAGWVQDGKAEYLGKRREARGHKVDAWRLKGTA